MLVMIKRESWHYLDLQLITNAILIVIFRYTLMLQCWEFEAKNRPTFSSLVSSLSRSLEAMADYMDVSSTIIPNSNCVDEKIDGARLFMRQ